MKDNTSVAEKKAKTKQNKSFLDFPLNGIFSHRLALELLTQWMRMIYYLGKIVSANHADWGSAEAG